jgi:hypothetical protein
MDSSNIYSEVRSCIVRNYWDTDKILLSKHYPSYEHGRKKTKNCKCQMLQICNNGKLDNCLFTCSVPHHFLSNHLNSGLRIVYSSQIDITWLGHAIAQADTCWLPTAVAWVCAQLWSSGICHGQSSTEAGFHRVLRFPLPVFIPPNTPSSQTPGTGIIGQKWPMCRLDPVWTPPPTIQI